jgi:hypothetical protein
MTLSRWRHGFHPRRAALPQRERRLSPDTRRGFTNQGAVAAPRRDEARYHQSPPDEAALRGFEARSEQASCAALTYARPRELDPSSIRSSTSCHGVASISAGEPEIIDRHRTEARRRSKRFRLADPASWLANDPRKPDLRAHIRYARAHRPLRSTRYSQGSACEPSITAATSLARVTPAYRHVWKVELLAQPSHPRAKGSHPSGAPRRATEIGDTRGAFRRWQPAWRSGLTSRSPRG